MKKLLTSFTIFATILLFGQKKYYILFNEKNDKIEYKKGRINNFKININGKYYGFVLSDIKSNYSKPEFEKKNNFNRLDLKKILDKDKAEMNNKYIIIIKRNNIYEYFYADHLVRTIID